MEKIDNIQQRIIYSNVNRVGPGIWEFLHDSDKEYHGFPEYDFHIPIFLTRTSEIFEYVQIDKSEKIDKIIRQEVNPFFAELSFFDGIKKNKVRYGDDLTSDMINFIRESRVEVLDASNSEVKLWFDQIGVNEFPWNSGTSSQVTLDDIEKINLTTSHIISKANYFKIDINK